MNSEATTIPAADYFTAPSAQEQVEAELRTHAPSAQWHKVTFPLRPNVEISLILPLDLTDAEAQRVGLFLRSMAQG